MVGALAPARFVELATAVSTALVDAERARLRAAAFTAWQLRLLIDQDTPSWPDYQTKLGLLDGDR